MSITCKLEANIVLWTYGKLIQKFQNVQNVLMAQCAWWIFPLVRLQPALVYYLDHEIFPSKLLHYVTIVN